MRSNEEFIMKPKVDFCFKELMEDEEVRRGFISAILNVRPEEIGETTLLPTYLRKTYPEEKYGILDVHVKIIGKHASEMDIEIQVAPFGLWAERSLFYLSKMFFSQIEEGENYEELNKYIHVGILDFTLFEGDVEFYSCFHLWEDRRRRKFTDKLEIHIIELPKWTQKSLPGSVSTEPENVELQSWTGFLGAKSKEELEMAANTNPYVEKAYERLLHISMDKEKRREYEAREKAIRDYNWQMESRWRQGHEAGVDVGMEKKLIEQVCRKLQKGKGAEEIAEDLDEDLGEIRKICQAAREFAQEYDSASILEKLLEKKE
ncbi:MAG: Rpn family recombination-promoting nuclease/putative transposase [Lachnospiraceae bacterium]|nr:Rpn family recombination-promoting nuclease/putative transposase [Lachnospiraceae bacterium]